MNDNDAPRGWAEIDIEQARRDEEDRLRRLDQERQVEERQELHEALTDMARRDGQRRRARADALIDDLLTRRRDDV